jgi:hypothetical protein
LSQNGYGYGPSEYPANANETNVHAFSNSVNDTLSQFITYLIHNSCRLNYQSPIIDDATIQVLIVCGYVGG